MHYEHMKHSGELPLIGVNTFLDEEAPDLGASARSLARHAWCFSVHFCSLTRSLTHSLTHHSSSTCCFRSLLSLLTCSLLTNQPDDADAFDMEITRATDEEKQGCLARLDAFQTKHAAEAPAALKRLQDVARGGGNVFEELMETVKVASLGQITEALFKVGGQYRRNM